jgi:predicted AlkP superfamily pyrophosphatase or phosphodiesterase
MANEKKQKMQLMQELDSIKDHFTEWQTQMICQELDSDIFAAANYLNEQVQNNYYLLLLVLMNLQDIHGVAGTC